MHERRRDSGGKERAHEQGLDEHDWMIFANHAKKSGDPAGCESMRDPCGASWRFAELPPACIPWEPLAAPTPLAFTRCRPFIASFFTSGVTPPGQKYLACAFHGDGSSKLPLPGVAVTRKGPRVHFLNDFIHPTVCTFSPPLTTLLCGWSTQLEYASLEWVMGHKIL